MHEAHALTAAENLCGGRIKSGQIECPALAYDKCRPDIGAGCIHYVELCHILTRYHHVTQEQVVVFKSMRMHVFDSNGHFFDELRLFLFANCLALLVEPVTGEVVHAHGLRNFFCNNESMNDAAGKTMIAPGNKLRNTQTPAGKFLQVLVFSADH
jgi:hypothetical protein